MQQSSVFLVPPVLYFSTAYGHTTEQPGSVPQSHFTDSAALQIYRVASLLLNFQILLGLTGMITKRTRTVCFCFCLSPQLDQATAIVAELCDICREVCRINPVFGRVDNFSKDFKMLVKASGVHAYMETSMDSLKKIALFLYPRLL
ncbi:hypothetical protein BRARA_H01844 [Brassica rapa]|uniref:Uncharacterized protein n=1 Tax=Brassica campestris TaxID=3711 RepID=A0A397YE53_BRACM|nr:hypothetical protein BRARA_H01844 [Brassica rapa]